MTKEKYQREYLGIFVSDKEVQRVCGECKFFDNGCTTSQIENKYGNSRTSACAEFSQKEIK